MIPGIRGASPSGSAHSMTSTARAPRESMTSTVAPCGKGVSDQARKHSEPPRTFIRTSPGPATPRVATVSTPTVPIEASSRVNNSHPPYGNADRSA
jgi:hypothetical protein